MLTRVIEMKKTIDYKRLIPAVVLPLLVGAAAAFIVKDNFGIYELLYKPLLAPPAKLFPVVWTVLYVLMGIASYKVVVSDAGRQRKLRALKSYALQLVLNFLWPILFFGGEMFAAALLCAVLLLGAILVCYLFFSHISQTAGYLLLPYVFWSLFAVYLNIGILLLN